MFDWCPRPERDNGIGLHDDAHAGDDPGTVGFMHSVIDAMADLNFKWLKLLIDVNQKSGRLALISHARERGIMVIVRPYRKPCHPSLNLYDDFIKAVLDAGAPYMEDGNEPNLASIECSKLYPQYEYDGIKGHTAFVNLLYDQWCNEGERIRRLGGIPLFPAMSPTAYTSEDVFFHHALYEQVIGLGKLRGDLHWAFENAGIAIHNRPSENPLDAQDKCAFSDYTWIEDQFKNALGREVPLFGTEAGYEDGNVGTYILHQLGNLYPNNDDYIRYHKILNHEMFARFNPQHPKAWKDYLICECAWLTADNGWFGSGWVRNTRTGNRPLPSFTDMKEISGFTRAEGTPYEPPEEEEPEVPEPGLPTGTESIEFVNLSQQMIDILSLSGPQDASQPYWEVTAVEVQPQTDNFSAWVIAPAGHKPVLFWGTGEAEMPWKEPDPYAPAGARNGAYTQPMFSRWGSYGVRMDGNSEALFGIGLYAADLNPQYTGHRPTLVYFQLVQPQEPTEPPEPPEPPTPPEEVPYEFGAALSKRLVAAGVARMVDVRDRIENDYALLMACGDRKPDAATRVERYLNITLHHTASKVPLDVFAIAKNHTDMPPTGRGFPHIAYAFVINRDGTVWWTKRLRYYSAHSGNARFNKYSIAVAVHGDFTLESPSEAQLKALKCVTDSLEEWVGEAQGRRQPLPIVRHRDIVNTQCPGCLYEKYREYLSK